MGEPLVLTDMGKALIKQRFRDPEANLHVCVLWEEAKTRLMAPFNLKKALAPTQRRKGAKTRGFRFQGSFARRRDRIIAGQNHGARGKARANPHDSVLP
jgi:hypothetical protein